MNTGCDKIRILWIDDCEGRDAGYMYPEKTLPTGEFEQYFQIVRHPDIPGPSTMGTPQEFGTCFGPFWWGTGDTDILPPEIIAMDYNLRKWLDAKVVVTKKQSKMPSYLKSGVSKHSGVVDENSSSGENREWKAGFEGLVLGIFTSSLLHQHPIGIVPMTNYGDLLENIPEVRALHLISKEILHIDYSKFGVSGEDRSWDKVLRKGVKALRVRIENLYEDGQIILSPSDLMALSEDANHGILTISSTHVERRLPVQGLFIDAPEEERDEAIRKWAKDLMSTVMVDCEELKQAQELAGQVWDAYNNNKLVEERRNLSLLAARIDAGKEIDETEYERLSEIFGVHKKKCKSGCVDIFSGDYSARVRRWAALFVTCNMLKRLILIKKRIETHVQKTTGRAADIPDIPILNTDDLFLTLFPVPNAPLVFPWHKGENPAHNSATWTTEMLRWKDKIQYTKKKGDLALSLSDLLAGECWNTEDPIEGPHGLTDSERLVLQGFAFEESDLCKSDWKSYDKANKVLWGK